jgi:hypothetical protein
MNNRWPEAWKWVSVAILHDAMTKVADGSSLNLDKNRTRLRKPSYSPSAGEEISYALRYCVTGKREFGPTMFLLEGEKLYPPTRMIRSIWVLITNQDGPWDIGISISGGGSGWYLGLDTDLCAVMADYLDEERWKQ